MKRKLIAAFALCALVLSGCSGSKPSVSTAPDTPKNDGTYTLEEIRTNNSIEKILQDHAVFTCSTGIYAAADSDAPAWVYIKRESICFTDALSFCFPRSRFALSGKGCHMCPAPGAWNTKKPFARLVGHLLRRV